MKLLKKWYSERHSHGKVFARIVSNVHSVMTDTRLFEQTFVTQVGSGNDVHLDDEKETEDVVYRCACGDVLERKEAGTCYENSSWLYCDLCYTKMGGSEIVYHCDKKEGVHPNGYDLCEGC